MSATYTKRGATVRYENGVLVTVIESGEAWLDGKVFHARPAKERTDLDAEVDRDAVIDAVARLRRAVPPHVAIERLIVTSGVADHRFGERTWRDAPQRVHASFVHGRERLLLDSGDLDVAPFAAVIEQFASMDPAGEPPVELRLAPRVSAAIVPMLLASPPRGVTLRQVAHGVDGNGAPVVAMKIDAANAAGGRARAWPNVWRPSYRVRPLHVPMNVMAEHEETSIDPALPVAVALLRPASSRAIRVLVSDGRRSWPADVVVDGIRAIGPEQSWHPFHAGSFGGEMVL